MRVNVPISAGVWAGFSRWDILAFLLILGLLVFLGEASRHLFEPLTELQNAADIARSAQSARICRAHHAAHAHRHGAVADLHFHLCDAGRQKQNGGAYPGAAARHSAIGADPRLHLGHRRVLHGARAGPRARRRVRLDLRDFHQPSLEYGLQLLSVAAHDPDRARRGLAQFWALSLDEILAARRAVRDAAAHLEHDDVDVGELVLRRRLGSDQRRQHDGHAAGHRLLYRGRHRTPRSYRGVLGDRHHAGRDLHLRPGAVPAAGGMGRSLPLRAGARRAGARIMGVQRAAAVAFDRTIDDPVRGALAAHVSPAPARQARARRADCVERGRAVLHSRPV